MRRSFVVLSSLLALACSSDPDQAGPGAGGSGGSGAASGGGTGIGGGTNLPPNPGHGGLVQALSGMVPGDTGPVAASAAFAYFWDAPGAAAGECVLDTQGACTVTICAGGTPAQPTTISAGAITVTGNKSLTLLPDAMNEYEMVVESGLLWDPGQNVTVSVAGATVPAFTHAQLASSAVTITSPAAPPADTPLMVDRGQDLEVAWTGGSTGAVTMMWKVDASQPDDSFVSILCRFAAADGAGTVPTAALQALPASGTGDLLLLGGEIDALEVGDYTVQVMLNSLPTWGTESGTAQFEATN